LTVLLPHLLHAALAALQGLDGCLLGHGGSAHDRVLMDLHHGFDDVVRAAGKADAPAGHGESLGKSMQKKRALLHAGKGGDGMMRQIVVGELAVDFVGEDDQIVLHGKGGDLCQLIGGHDSPGGVGRETEHQDARAGRDGLFQVGGAEHKFILGAGRDRDRLASGQRDARAVGDITWLVVEHLVARIEQGAQGEIDSLGDAHGDDDFVMGVVGDGEILLHILGNRAAQAWIAEIGGVAGAALFQGIDGGLADMPRRDKVGLTDTEGDDPLHRLDDFKKVADSRTGNVAHMRRNA